MTLQPDVVAFRKGIIAALGPTDRRCYIDRDTVVGVCPACDQALTASFHGTAGAADLRCHRICTEPDILTAMGLDHELATDDSEPVDPRIEVLRERREEQTRHAGAQRLA